jgi:hypothetical protein
VAECSEILDGVIENIHRHYDFLENGEQKKKLTRNSSLWTSMLLRKASQQSRLF